MLKQGAVLGQRNMQLYGKSSDLASPSPHMLHSIT